MYICVNIYVLTFIYIYRVRLEAVDVKVLFSCNPKITISGLMNTQTASSTINVTNVEDNNNVVAAQWSNIGPLFDGSLVLNLTKLFPTAAESTQDSHKTTFLFHFDLNNPAGAQSDNIPKLEGGISRLDSSQTSLEQTIQAFSTNYLREKVTNSTLTKVPGASQYHKPVTVKQLDFSVQSIRQSSPYPCDANMIVVDFRTNTKLLKLCSPTLTISSLKGSYSVDDPALPVSQFNSSGSISGTGAWTQSSGTLILQLQQDALHETVHSFSFVLYNPSKNPPAVTVSIKATLKSFFPNVAEKMSWEKVMDKSNGDAPQDIYKSSIAPYANSGEASPLFIRNLQYELKNIRQVRILHSAL